MISVPLPVPFPSVRAADCSVQCAWRCALQGFIPMEVHDQSRVRHWHVALVLLVVYAVYVPHLFLTIFVTPEGHSLAGPWKGWEVLLGIGVLFWVTVPLFGDLSFWVASVLFARRQFRFALIMGAIGLGLCATFYSYFVLGSYRGSASPQGALWRQFFG